MFLCTSCKYQSPYKLGKCPHCWALGMMIPQIHSRDVGNGAVLWGRVLQPNESSSTPHVTAYPLSHPEWAKVFWWSLMAWGVYLLGGRPWVGKSTASLSLLDQLSSLRCGYFSWEEQPSAIHARFARMMGKPLTALVYYASRIDDILATIEQEQFACVVIDSIQMMRCDDSEGSSWSVWQIKESTQRLVDCAKRTGCIVWIIGHITKDGAIAWPKYLEHIVDVVCTIEGEDGDEKRIVRMSKNRFGTDQSLGLFVMTATWLEAMVPEALRRDPKIFAWPWLAFSIGIDNGRAMPVQIEVLLTKTTGRFPLRHYVWIDAKRCDMLCAIAEKYCKLPMSSHDVYVHIPGGIVYRDSGLDLAFIAALASAIHHKTIVPRVWIGEVWLRGYVTKPSSLPKRLLECSGASVIDAQSIKTVGDIYSVR